MFFRYWFIIFYCIAINLSLILGIEWFKTKKTFLEQELEGDEYEVDILFCEFVERLFDPEIMGDECWSGCQQLCKATTLHPDMRKKYKIVSFPQKLKKCKTSNQQDGTRILCKAVLDFTGKGAVDEAEHVENYIIKSMTPDIKRIYAQQYNQHS